MAISLQKGILIFFLFYYSFGQTDDFIPEITVPDATTGLSFGFNYDYLRSPLNVSFDYPVGYFGINVPFKQSVPKGLISNLTEDLSSWFRDSAEFIPDISANQNPNTTIKVDVPMMGGVATFSNMQMMYLRYILTLGLPDLEISPDEEASNNEMALLLRGIISVPLDLAMGWETMTFGYAYEVNDKLKFALNLHRHTLTFDVSGKIDIDLLGYFKIQVQDGLVNTKENLSYSLHNVISGHYSAETWTPSFAAKYWRLSLISRFGMNIKPKGYLKAKYAVPFFVDPDKFSIDDELTDPENMEPYLIDNMDKFLNSDLNEVEYSTTKKMTWKMPQAHTFMFDIVPDKFSVSYTKLFGNIEMELFDPESDKQALIDTSSYPDTLDFRFKASVDHMIIIHGNFFSSFFNIGIYSLDFAFGDKENLLSGLSALEKLKFGNGIMTPLLNIGALVGSKIKLLIELDILPLTAFKTGIVYYF